jgi:hypothetical protein
MNAGVTTAAAPVCYRDVCFLLDLRPADFEVANRSRLLQRKAAGKFD